MKKMVILIGLLALLVLVVGCTQGTLAGQAVSTTSAVVKDDLISLNGHILEYNGADASTTSPQRISFKDWSTGETLIYNVERGQASIRLSGDTYLVRLGNPRRIDPPLIVDYDGEGTLDKVHSLNSLHFITPGVSVQCPPEGLRCDNQLTLLEGETITTTAQDINGMRGEHDLLLAFINSTSVRLIVDGTSPETIHNRQSEVVNNVMVTAWYVLYQDYAGGVHSVTLCVGE